MERPALTMLAGENRAPLHRKREEEEAAAGGGVAVQEEHEIRPHEAA